MTDDAVDDGHEPDIDTVQEKNRVAKSRSDRLREAASRVGSNKALSSKSGVPISTLNSYLAGGEPKISTLNAIAEASGLSFEWLALGTGRPDITVVRGNHDIDRSKIDRLISDPPHPGFRDEGRTSFALFSSINIDQLARAMVTADQNYAVSGGKPTYREKAQMVALIYDFITIQDTKRMPGEPSG